MTSLDLNTAEHALTEAQLRLQENNISWQKYKIQTIVRLWHYRHNRVGGKMKLYPVVLIILIFFFGCKNDARHQYTGVLEGTAVKVPALAGGQILALYVDSGDQVVKDQKIAVIDSTELVFQRQQLQAALLELQIQQEIARTTFDKITSDLAYVQEKYDRVAQLYQKNSAPRQNLDDAQNQLQTVNSSHRSARQNLQSLAARQQQVQAQLNLANKKIRDTVILSPRAGIVTTKFYRNGRSGYAAQSGSGNYRYPYHRNKNLYK